MELLLGANADVNQVDKKGATPLWTASLNGHYNCLKLLLARPGINVVQADNDGGTPLHAAAHEGKYECVELLLGATADINQTKDGDGRTPSAICWFIQGSS